MYGQTDVCTCNVRMYAIYPRLDDLRTAVAALQSERRDYVQAVLGVVALGLRQAAGNASLRYYVRGVLMWGGGNKEADAERDV